MNNPPRTEASLTTRAQVWFQSVPLVTKAILVLCSSLAALALLTGLDLAHPACLNAQKVVEKLQLYRTFTAAIIHTGVLHAAFNMLAFTPLAASLERQWGSTQLLYLLFLFLLLGDAFYIVFAYLTDGLFGSGLTGCAVGLSGVIFALVVADTHLSGAQQRSIFGFFNLPAAYFPWALLVLWQLLLPHVSFFGHLGGILAGQLYVWGWLKRLIPSAETFQAAERLFPLRTCLRFDSFICHNGGSTLPTSIAASDSGSQSIAAPIPAAWLRQNIQGWLRVPSSEPPESTTAVASQSSRGRERDGGKAHVLGGSSSASASAAAPKQAAAAAAEARAQRSSSRPPGPQSLQQSQHEKPSKDRDKPHQQQED